MKDILLKRNKLKASSSRMSSMRFDPDLKQEQVDYVAQQQSILYNKWNFYDKFIKAREEVKSEEKKFN